MTGRVVSIKLKNTATVLVSRIAMHPLYKKTYVRTKRFLVDDQIGVKDGDIVEIIKCKPISRNKHWRIVKVTGANLQEIAEAKLKQAAAEVISEAMPVEKKMTSVPPVGRQVMPKEKISENSEKPGESEDQNVSESDSSDKSDTQSHSDKKKTGKKKEIK